MDENMSLEEFVDGEIMDLMRFKEWWKIQNSINPGAFPMEMDKNNTGLWTEQYALWDRKFFE